jgi:hypothetical protein
MHMQVHHALPGRRSYIHADIIAVGDIVLIQQPTGIMDERQKGGLFIPGRLEERGHVPEGDEQEVAGAHRVQVEPGICEIIFENDIGGGGVTERAGHGIILFSLASSTLLRKLCRGLISAYPEEEHRLRLLFTIISRYYRYTLICTPG